MTLGPIARAALATIAADPDEWVANMIAARVADALATFRASTGYLAARDLALTAGIDLSGEDGDGLVLLHAVEMGIIPSAARLAAEAEAARIGQARA
jgi:hypothetical protein